MVTGTGCAASNADTSRITAAAGADTASTAGAVSNAGATRTPSPPRGEGWGEGLRPDAAAVPSATCVGTETPGNARPPRVVGGTIRPSPPTPARAAMATGSVRPTGSGAAIGVGIATEAVTAPDTETATDAGKAASAVTPSTGTTGTAAGTICATGTANGSTDTGSTATAASVSSVTGRPAAVSGPAPPASASIRPNSALSAVARIPAGMPVAGMPVAGIAIAAGPTGAIVILMPHPPARAAAR